MLAQAMDHLHGIEKRLARAQVTHRKKTKKLQLLEEQIKKDPRGLTKPTGAELEKKRTQATQELEKSSRKVAREQVKLIDAVQRVKELSTTNG